VTIAIDSTGLEERHASRHYLTRCRGRRSRQQYWTKNGTALHTATYMIISHTCSKGPGDECGLFPRLSKTAGRYLPLDTLLADAGFDSEANHVYAREKLNVRLSVIKLNPRSHGRKWPQTKYRRQMRRRFLCKRYKERVHAESAYSQMKRRLGSVLHSRRKSTRRIEVYLRVLVHNLMHLPPPT
jgi:hypothetical protein